MLVKVGEWRRMPVQERMFRLSVAATKSKQKWEAIENKKRTA